MTSSQEEKNKKGGWQKILPSSDEGRLFKVLSSGGVSETSSWSVTEHAMAIKEFDAGGHFRNLPVEFLDELVDYIFDSMPPRVRRHALERMSFEFAKTPATPFEIHPYVDFWVRASGKGHLAKARDTLNRPRQDKSPQGKGKP